MEREARNERQEKLDEKNGIKFNHKEYDQAYCKAHGKVRFNARRLITTMK